jgi:hypothetical protein
MENYNKITNNEYTTPELAQILGVTTRKIISMLEREYFKASIQEASGHSSRRLFSFSDVFQAFITSELLSFGMSVDYMRGISILIKDNMFEMDYLLVNKYGEPCVTHEDPKKNEESMLEHIKNPVGGITDKEGLPDTSPLLCIPFKDMKVTLVRRIEKTF